MGKVGSDYVSDYTATYVVGDAVAESHQYMEVFLPDPILHPQPADGYPVLMATEAGGFTTTPATSTLEPGTPVPILEWQLLENLGIAVISVGMTGTYREGGAALNVDSNGRGLFHPPGTDGWDDELRYSAPKEGVLAVQKAHQMADTWGINADKIIVQGRSSGSVAFTIAVFDEDHADPSKADHRAFSSRVYGYKFAICQVDWSIYEGTHTIAQNFCGWPDATGDITTDLATRFDDIPAGYLYWANILEIGMGTQAARDRNANLKVHLYGFLSGNNLTDYSLTGTWGTSTGKRPTTQGTIDSNTALAFHEIAGPVMLMTAMRETDTDLYFTRYAMQVWDFATYVSMIFTDADQIDRTHAVREAGFNVQKLIEEETDFLGFALLGGVVGYEIRFNDDPAEIVKELTADIYSVAGVLVREDITMWHMGKRQYAGHFPQDPTPDPGKYTVRINNVATQIGEVTVYFTGEQSSDEGLIHARETGQASIDADLDLATIQDFNGADMLTATAYDRVQGDQGYRHKGVERQERATRTT